MSYLVIVSEDGIELLSGQFDTLENQKFVSFVRILSCHLYEYHTA